MNRKNNSYSTEQREEDRRKQEEIDDVGVCYYCGELLDRNQSGCVYH